MSETSTGRYRLLFFGIRLVNEVPGNCATNRPYTLELNGRWYFLHHNGALPGGDSHHRSVCIDHLECRPDGTIEPVVMTSHGISHEP